jgi:uroporphyrinogen III methyltransferase/synthase
LSSTGIVYLVGAGPGDPGLITRRGADVLARADVVLYDRLVHPDVLKLAANARLIDVGKQPGESGAGQRDINELLLIEARSSNVVVRLKGGDPFVFGRGGEEAELLAANGIPFEVVPGVSSAIAGPAYAGIPLTHRQHASWAALATGHENPAKPSSAIDWTALAQAPTVVFLMGIERLATICDRLQAEGKPPDTPAAVVSWATWPHQRVVRSTLEKVAGATETAGVGPPAVLVVGDVVDLADRLAWIDRRPLQGLRVFVTRTRAQAGRLAQLLREAGAEPLEFPAIRIVPPSSFEAVDEAIRAMDADWVVFASTNAVEAFWDRLAQAKLDARALAGVRVAAVGSVTADALKARGIVADLVPSVFTSSALADAMGRAPTEGSRALVPQAETAPRELVEALERNGWSCEAVPAYRTERDDASVAVGRHALEHGVDAVLFTSGSTVRSFVELWGRPPETCTVCCIGPRTAEAAAELGVNVHSIAADQSVEGLVAALVAAVRR